MSAHTIENLERAVLTGERGIQDSPHWPTSPRLLDPETMRQYDDNIRRSGAPKDKARYIELMKKWQALKVDELPVTVESGTTG